MGVRDYLGGLRDRLWLRYNDLDHDIEVDDTLDEELSASTRRSMDQAVTALDEIVDDYDPAIYEVEELDDDTPAVGRYKGRDGARPLIRMDPDARKLPAIWAHELGHDVTATLDVLPDDSNLVTTTFDEMAAYLTMFEVAERTGDTTLHLSGPFRISHADEWQRLRDGVELDDVLAPVEDAFPGSYGEILDAAADVDHLHPETSGLERETSMIGAYLGNPAAADLQTLAAVDERERDEAVTMLQEAYVERDGPLQRRVQDTVEDYLEETFSGRHAVDMREQHDDVTGTVEQYEQERLDELYDDVMTDLVAETVEQALATERPDVEDAEDIVELLGGETYGSGEYGYDDYIDLPHPVGYELAQELYQDGTGIEDVLEDPERHAELAREALVYTVDHGLDGGSTYTYEIGEVLP